MRSSLRRGGELLDLAHQEENGEAQAGTAL